MTDKKKNTGPRQTNYMYVFIALVVGLLCLGFIWYKEATNIPGATKETINKIHPTSLKQEQEKKADMEPANLNGDYKDNKQWAQKKIRPTKDTFISMDDLVSPTVSQMSYDKNNYKLTGNSISLRGSVSTDISKIVVAYLTNNEEHELTRFEPGQSKWEYNARIYLGNLQRGLNEYEIRAYIDEKHEPVVLRAEVYADIYEKVAQDTGSIEVNWYKKLIPISTKEFVKDIELRPGGIKLIKDYEPIFGESMSGMTLDERLESLLTFHKIGTVVSGHYQGGDVYHLKVERDGMCGGDPNNYHRIIRSKDNKLFFLVKYSDGISSDVYELFDFTIDSDATMNLLPPETLSIPDSPLKLKRKNSYNRFASFQNPQTLLFNKEAKLNIVRAPNNCISAEHDDGTFSTYLWDLPTRKPDAEQKEAVERSGKFTRTGEGLLDITWNDGSKNTTQYVSRDYFGGFDLGCSYLIVDVYNNKIVDTDDFKGNIIEKIGTTSWGEDVYKEVYSKKQLDTFDGVEDYNSKWRLFKAYSQYYNGNGKNIYEFYDQNHIIYIKDPFGRYMQFMNMEVIPAAEKCKPVIYLYPEEKTDVRVEVKPKGGFSITIPKYNDGWSVTALPNGTITNKEDNTQYPYLFWEGFGSKGYRMHDEGFLLQREEVSCKLPDLLYRQGMRGKEIDDFMEYWLPQLQQKPYYYITFMPQAEFEKEAPLTIDPKPNTLIRVFMDYQGLDEKIFVVPQKLTAPERSGFTVIEWGGAKH